MKCDRCGEPFVNDGACVFRPTCLCDIYAKAIGDFFGIMASLSSLVASPGEIEELTRSDAFRLACEQVGIKIDDIEFVGEPREVRPGFYEAEARIAVSKPAEHITMSFFYPSQIAGP